MFGIIKFFMMMAMVVWIAAAVAAMTSGVMGMIKSRMPWMKEELRERMPEMRSKMNEGMTEAEEHLQ
jgi:hypothetical protein